MHHQNTKKTIPTKYSVGIACVRLHEGRPEILLVQKRVSYAYSDFVQGRYVPGMKADITRMFNEMTLDEKLDILSLDFEQMWYRLWLGAPRHANFYIAKSKFESGWLMDEGARLRRLVATSSNGDRLWEIPKGHKLSHHEQDINCAVREFGEETGMRSKKYKLYPTFFRTYSYIDNGVNYHNKYYAAYTKYHIDLSVKTEDMSQAGEISDIRWMNMDGVRYVDPTRRLEK